MTNGTARARSLRNRVDFLSLVVADNKAWAVSHDGHVRASDNFDDVVYVAVTRSGEHVTLSSDEFTRRFNWINDPSRVTFGPPQIRPANE